MVLGDIKLGQYYRVNHDGVEKTVKLIKYGRRGGWFGIDVHADVENGDTGEVYLPDISVFIERRPQDRVSSHPPKPIRAGDDFSLIANAMAGNLPLRKAPQYKAPPKPIRRAHDRECPICDGAGYVVDSQPVADDGTYLDTVTKPCEGVRPKAPPKPIRRVEQRANEIRRLAAAASTTETLQEAHDRLSKQDGPKAPPRPIRRVQETPAVRDVMIDLDTIRSETSSLITDIPLATKAFPRGLKLSEILGRNAPSTAGGKHLVVNALAGTGKTTTIVEIVNRSRGQKKLKGTKQQEAIFDEVLRHGAPKTIALLAFNVSIASAMKERVGSMANASTIHSMAGKVCSGHFKGAKLEKFRSGKLLEEYHGESFHALKKQDAQYVSNCLDIARLAKLTLCEDSPEAYANLVTTYDIDLSPIAGERCYTTVGWMLHRAKETVESYDFDDLLWLPIVLGLKIPQYDLVLVDELQDLSRVQQEFCRRVGRRMVGVGDRNQAIYGFAGADTQSIPRMVSMLNEDGDCTELPLTMTRRCGAAIVEEAKRIVPSFEGHPDNGPGSVVRGVEQKEADAKVQDGDMVLCRTNAPLVSLVFRYIKMNRKAIIRGRSIGDNLIAFIDNVLAPSTVVELHEKVEKYAEQEIARLYKRKWVDEAQIINVTDKRDCVISLAEGAKTVSDVTARIKSIFDDNKTEGIILSSMHRAKGLEANNVWIREPQLLPHPMATVDWQIEQESNLEYVGITRARHNLSFVKGTPSRPIEEV